MLDAQRRDLILRHQAELEFLEAEGDVRTKRLVLGGVCARWARRSRAGAFVFWRENRRALEATRLRSATLLPRLVHSLSMRSERRQLSKALRQLRRHALEVRRRQINSSQGIRKLKRRLAIWVRRRRYSAFQTWRENAHDKQWRLALACGRVYPVSYTHLRAHETGRNLVCRLLLEDALPKRLVQFVHERIVIVPLSERAHEP